MRRLSILIVLCVLLCACTGNTNDTPVITDSPESTPESTQAVIEQTPAPAATTAASIKGIPITLQINDKDIPRVQDLTIDGYAAYATPEDIGNAFGESLFDEAFDDEEGGGSMRIVEYETLTLIYADEKLTGVLCDDAAPEGPRGLRVGSSAQEVIDAFKVDGIALENAADEQAQTITLYHERYIANTSQDDGPLEAGSLPPYGEILLPDTEGGMLRIEYVTPLAYTEGYYDNWAFKDDAAYIYDIQCSVNFRIEGGVVTRWYWSIGAFAE